MRKHLLLLLTLSALLAYRPGLAQAHNEGPSESSPSMVASARTKPVSSRVTPELTTAKSSVTTKKETKTVAKVTQKPISRIWSRIMGLCSEVHTAAKKKS